MANHYEDALKRLAKPAREALAHWTETCVDAGPIDHIVAGERLAGIVTRVMVLAEALQKEEDNGKAECVRDPEARSVLV